MAELRALLERLGHQDVATYLQSGQAIFTTEEDDEDALAGRIRASAHRTTRTSWRA
ncbi:DUF1697 domain-containing protein [Acidipropionibacterium virtanenii]|nr:DUF1697 domain-containing protein [Acidipropionibacterium virtanenii]